ncbi:MAG: hypothetical protein NTW96_26460 [Planctomycetia bacterium]|nr:hypothetical protein [Planctomycetia bacterium]
MGTQLVLKRDGDVDAAQAFVHNVGQIVLYYQDTAAGPLGVADLAHRYLWGPNTDELLADESKGVDGTPGTADDTAWALTDHQGTVRDLVRYNPATVAGRDIHGKRRHGAGPPSPTTGAACEFRERRPFALGDDLMFLHAGQGDALHRGRDGAADEAVEPMVVWGAGAELPFVDDSAAALGLHAVLGRDVLGEQSVLLGLIAEQRQATALAHGDEETGVAE